MYSSSDSLHVALELFERQRQRGRARVEGGEQRHLGQMVSGMIVELAYEDDVEILERIGCLIDADDRRSRAIGAHQRKRGEIVQRGRRGGRQQDSGNGSKEV